MTIIYSPPCQWGSPGEHTATLGACQWAISELMTLPCLPSRENTEFLARGGWASLIRSSVFTVTACSFSSFRCQLDSWQDSVVPFPETSNSPPRLEVATAKAVTVVFTQFLLHSGPLELSPNFLVSSAMHLQECLLYMSRMSSCSIMGSFQVILSSVLPEMKFLQPEVKWIKRGKQWMSFLNLSRKGQALAKAWIRVSEARWVSSVWHDLHCSWEELFDGASDIFCYTLNHLIRSLTLDRSHFPLGEWRSLFQTGPDY